MAELVITFKPGSGTRVIDVPPGGRVHVVAANWLTNQSPFIPRVVRTAEASADQGTA